MRYRIVAGWLLIALLAALPLGLAPVTAGPSFKGDIKIGTLYSKEGVWGSYGAKALRAIDLAVTDVNNDGGINGYRLAPRAYDNNARLDQVPALIRKMALDDKVLVIVGPNTSGEGEVAFPIAAQALTPILATSTAKGGIMRLGNHGGRQWAFRSVAPDDQNTAPVMEQVVKEKDIRTVAIIYDAKDAISSYMGNIFWTGLMKKLGVNIAEMVSFNSGDPSVAAQVTKMKAANPQAVILASSPGDAAKVAIEIQRQGWKPQLLGAGGLFGDEFRRAGGAAVEGAITAAQYWRENPDPVVQSLLKKYEARTREEAVLHEAYAYDAIIMLTDIMKKVNVTSDESKLQVYRSAIRDRLHGAVWKGMSGTYKLDPNGDVIRPFMMATVVKGQWHIRVLKAP